MKKATIFKNMISKRHIFASNNHSRYDSIGDHSSLGSESKIKCVDVLTE